MKLSKKPQDLTALVNRDRSESVCEHHKYCVVKQFGRDCSHPAYKTCQTWKFYNKYGEEGNMLGVGS